MEDDILTLLYAFEKDVENNSVVEKIERLATLHNYTSSTIVNMLLKYLTDENILNEIITVKDVENFVKQEILALNKENMQNSVIDSNEDINNSKVDIDTTFFGQYFPGNSEISKNDDLNTSLMDTTLIDEMEDISDDFWEVNWPVNICNESDSDYKIAFQTNTEVANVAGKKSLQLYQNKLELSEKLMNSEDLLNSSVYNPDETTEIVGQICLDHSQIEMKSTDMISALFDEQFSCCDDLFNKFEKLRPENIAIQYYSDNYKKIVIPLNLDKINSYSLFLGQNLTLKGTNLSKDGFVVSSVKQPTPNPTSIINPEEILGDLKMVIASGPFTSSDSDDINHLKCLMEKLKTNKCHVLILIGPLVVINQINQENNENSLDDIYLDRLSFIVESCIEMNTHLVIVPSIDDATKIPVFPQQCFRLPKDPIFRNPLIHFASNPSIIKIGPYIFGVNSADVLHHMSTQEINNNCQTNRIKRLCAHIINENNFYPLKPSHPEISVDWNLWNKKCDFGSVVPHCLILVSKFKTFKETVNNVLCINPGFISKDRRSTYCRLNITASYNHSNTFINKADCKFISLQSI